MKIHKTLPNNFKDDLYFKKYDEFLWSGDVLDLLNKLPKEPLFDLVVTSPPYNIGKSYENNKSLKEYFAMQKEVIELTDRLVKNSGSICWQVGNHIDKKKESIYPLDFGFHEIFSNLGYTLKNRIIWKFGHGMHAKKRLSGRYETILWYVKSQDYTFNLDSIRIPSKYEGKTYYKGPNKGKVSSSSKGKNPEDVWDIPNVKGNHVEKTIHPCQFPVGLIQRLVLGMSNPKDVVFDPYMGVGSAGIASIIHDRKFIGADKDNDYVKIAKERLSDLKKGKLKYRSHKTPIYDHESSGLSYVGLKKQYDQLKDKYQQLKDDLNV